MLEQENGVGSEGKACLEDAWAGKNRVNCVLKVLNIDGPG